MASGFCGIWLSWLLWLLWLLAFVAFVASVAFGFLAYPSICLYLSIFLSFFLAAVLLSLFALSCCLRCRDETKQGSKQARKQASTSCSPLDLVCCWGGAAPSPNPRRATKSALHLRHPRLPRNQYFKVNSPAQNFLTKHASCASSLSLCCFSAFSFFLFRSCSPFSFCFCFSFLFALHRRNQTRKRASKEASKQARAAHLWIWCAAGGALHPPPTPPAPPNLRFIPDTRACHEINILR